MKSKAWTEKFMQGVFFSCRLRFGAGGSSHLYLLICKWNPCNEKIGFGKFLTGEYVETEK